MFREETTIVEEQFGAMSGIGTTDAISAVHQLMKNTVRNINYTYDLSCIDTEEPFD